MRAALTKNTPTLRATIAYLNSNGVTGHVSTPKERAYGYNCWGFTRGILESSTRFTWVARYDMEDWLQENTREINMHKEPLKCGDIVVFRGVDEEECFCEQHDDEEYAACTCEPELLHTAILVDPVKMIIIHKPGGRALERCTVEHVLKNAPHYGDVTEFRRLEK